MDDEKSGLIVHVLTNAESGETEVEFIVCVGNAAATAVLTYEEVSSLTDILLRYLEEPGNERAICETFQ